MDNDYKETERTIIREQGDNLLVKVSGAFMGQFPTTSFELWSNKEAYKNRQYRDGEKIYCQTWAVSEATAVINWEKIINKA